MFGCSALLDCSQQSTEQEESSPCFWPHFPARLVIIHCRFLSLSNRVPTAGREWLFWPADGTVTAATGKAGLAEVISEPLFGQRKIQAYLPCVLRSGLVCCDSQLAGPAPLQPPQRLVLFTGWAASLINGRMFGMVCRWTRMQITQFWNFNLEWFTALSSHILKAVSFFFQCLVYVLHDAFCNPSLGQRKQN